MATRTHSGRRNSVDPKALVRPDSLLARDAEAAAHDLLSPVLLNHSRRAYAWGADIAALDEVEFDRELNLGEAVAVRRTYVLCTG
jgi:hypothetical protein